MLKLKLIAGMLGLAALLSSAWMVRGWREDAKQLDTMAQEVQELKNLIALLEAFNEKTAERERDMLNRIDDTKRRLSELEDEVKNTDVGTARLTDDADRLRLDIHRAAVTGQAGGVDATD